MEFRAQKMYNYGTATPAVARTAVQGPEILGFFNVSQEKKEDAKAALFETMRHLLRCTEIADALRDDIEAAKLSVKENGLHYQAGGRVLHLPGVVDLQSRAESFLQSAKLAIGCVGSLVEPFHGKDFRHKFNGLAAWAKENLGEQDPLTITATEVEPWVRQIVDMRNAVDHPKNVDGGRLLTYNFRSESKENSHRLVDPTWQLQGGNLGFIEPEMRSTIEGIIRLGEDILISLFEQQKGHSALKIYEIPVEERDATCPIRLRVGLLPGLAKFDQKPEDPTEGRS